MEDKKTINPLTKRELEVIKLIADCNSNTQIGSLLGISH